MKVFLILALFTAAAAADLSPVSRVVELLQGLSKQVEKDGKAEEDLYESFVCWGNSVIKQKTATNAAAASKINDLETYIADLASGRIELTSERTDLEKDIAELSADMEEAQALRTKENADFEDAKAEMTSAITGLGSAMDVLDQATKDHKQGVLLAVRARLSHGMEALQEHQLNLKHAVKLGEKFLDKADATFLRRMLTGDVPKPDWKKLNRKATFKMGYKARSFKIQEVLKKMHETFTANLDEAKQNEADAKGSFDNLYKSKGDQLSAAQEALSKSDVENGSKQMSKQDASDDVRDLKQQVQNDERFIKQTTTDLANKKKEWKVRSNLRAGELEAISKAIYILHNDDSRDNFKQSFASQESLFFLQEGQQSLSASSALRNAARKSGDTRLLALAKLVKSSTPANKNAFKPVLAAIDKMIDVLKGEETTDLNTKQDCEKGRMEDTREAALSSRAIDDMSDAMAKLDEEVAQLEKEIESMKAEKKQTKEELDEATRLRKDENSEWKLSDADDKEAAETVNNAKNVLENFYKDNNLVFVQKAVAPVVEAGEAPPPPPPTFDAPYGGKTGESMGIVAILQMVHDDIIKDQKKAKQEEDDSQESFDTFKKESDDKIEELGKSISDAKGTKGRKEREHGNVKGQRSAKKGGLDAVLDKMAEISPNCEYFAVNYKLRTSNRQVEIDGLVQAKAILQGGKFAKAADPNREMKPGDAFLQRKA